MADLNVIRITQERPKRGWAKVPVWLYDPTLTMNANGPNKNAIWIYGALAGIWGNYGTHESREPTSIRQIAIDLKTSRKTVKRGVDDLEESGALVVEHVTNASGHQVGFEFRLALTDPRSDPLGTSAHPLGTSAHPLGTSAHPPLGTSAQGLPIVQRFTKTEPSNEGSAFVDLSQRDGDPHCWMVLDQAPQSAQTVLETLYSVFSWPAVRASVRKQREDVAAAIGLAALGVERSVLEATALNYCADPFEAKRGYSPRWLLDAWEKYTQRPVAPDADHGHADEPDDAEIPTEAPW